MNEYTQWLQTEIDRAEADYEMSTAPDDALYHQGEVDALREALHQLTKEQN